MLKPCRTPLICAAQIDATVMLSACGVAWCVGNCVFHTLLAKQSFCFESIMQSTAQAKVGNGFGASNRVRIDMIELQEVALAAAPPLSIDKGALTCVPFEYRSPDVSSGLSPAIGFRYRGTIRYCDATASRDVVEDASWIRNKWIMAP